MTRRLTELGTLICLTLFTAGIYLIPIGITAQMINQDWEHMPLMPATALAAAAITTATWRLAK